MVGLKSAKRVNTQNRKQVRPASVQSSESSSVITRIHAGGLNQAGKYGNKRVQTADGQTFDSHKEYSRYLELKLLERGGYIKNLRRQVAFELLPSQKRDGKVIERPVVYKADFVYEEDGEEVVEDVKSEATKTKEYILKRKLMLWQYGIRIKEV